MTTVEELESQVLTLKAEIERLRGGVNSLMTLGSASSLSQTDQRFTIQGLDEMIMVLDSEGRLNWLNDRMAILLGLPPAERSKFLGTSLSDLDSDSLIEVVWSIFGAVKASRDQYTAEREFPGLGPDRLPSLETRRVRDVPLLRFTATLVRDKIQIVAQDITHTNWLVKNFSRYLSPRVIEQMQTIPEDQLLKTERREATVLFADLSGFTSACQELQPDQVVEMVNSFLTNAVDAVDHFEGMVDKFVGDEIMAVFGVPLPTPDHALRALMAAQRIKKAHEQWRLDRQGKGLAAPGVHIGVASGEVIVGNIGTSARVDYTVLGHTVNLAARLCGEAKSGDIFTLTSTHRAAKEGLNFYSGADDVPRFHFDTVGEISLKNIKTPVKVISVMIKD